MIGYKIYCHIMAFLWKLYYKVTFGSKLKLGKNFQFRKGFSLLLDNSGELEISENVFFNNYCSICAKNKIVIGEGTIFGENVKIYDHNHIYRDSITLIKNQGYTSAPIHIGKHCWIGSNVTILKGVTIGDNSVIGAGCVIYKDVAQNSLVLNRQELIYKQI